jgi:hypothetical protein
MPTDTPTHKFDGGRALRITIDVEFIPDVDESELIGTADRMIDAATDPRHVIVVDGKSFSNVYNVDVKEI